jgi:uncharacterized protein
MHGDETLHRGALKARITQALKDESARDTPDEVRLATLRLIDCAVRDRDVCARGRGDGTGCPDAAVRDVLEIMIEQRLEAANEHEAALRFEEAQRERSEIEIIESFLPVPLEGPALKAAVATIVEDLGASKLKDLGRCMSALKELYPDRIEPAAAGKAVREALTRRAG